MGCDGIDAAKSQRTKSARNLKMPPQPFGQLPQQVEGAQFHALSQALLGEVAEGRRGH
jgi:hypothetical protein